MTKKYERSNDPRLGPGSLWTAMPIPALKTLTYAGEGQARDVLNALVLHSGNGTPYVFPTVETIQRFSRVGPNNIKKSIDVLVNYGFIKVKKIPKGKACRHQYEILRACYHYSEFNEIAKRFIVPKGICTTCWTLTSSHEWIDGDAFINDLRVRMWYHINCGGRIKKLTKTQIQDLKKRRESVEVPSIY
ncbi:hypothetical protein MCEMZLE22_01261 [actinobacterium SCGC AAA044-D11]